MPTPAAENPCPKHIEQDSMLARRFGKETANYFSSSPLNRVSFLRSEPPFLMSALRHPTARFLLFNQLAPLVHSSAEVFYATYQDVEPLVPVDLFDKSEEESLKTYHSGVILPLLVFLGLDESCVTNGLSYKSYTGVPYFALDVTPTAGLEEKANMIINSMKSRGLSFHNSRTITSFSPSDAAIYAQSRAIIDWNTRNAFCGTCGHPTISINAGAKRACPPTDLKFVANGSSIDGARPPCHTRTTISNLCFPRTDPTIIVAVLSHDSNRILLGRQKRWPPCWYSTLAGFIEPGESVEDAVRREVWEESGVVLSRVIIHSSQPWPYPANLMIGAIAQVSDPSNEKISLLHDPELEDAKWFEIADVEEALSVGSSPLGVEPGPEYKKGNLRLPPKTAIAHQLISAVVRGEYLGAPYESKI
ncbi:NADH pyrophosphatase [Ophidiomyces ophidiicola]|nr:NADH pyrophosphatase [Ophidiomyces ophidiicola]KAI1931531.1 NADH pyrophosphatase [Ophidiomyces ophidiicola]KAI1969136.1 NADH pyrophosphatase [Ophidiomyces ophidiicola]KAI2037255.1 NADH pyrophosphatase [Ophidiomyces ophidiicola]KAI2150393.1 NADH pyrophosphatase [Ophidiomyces ophidiicola]